VSTNRGILLLALLLASQAPLWGRAGEDPPAVREYRVKAAFVYNFLKFVVGGRFVSAEDDKNAKADPNRVLRIGVLGQVPAREGFVELQGKLVRDQRLEVQFFPGFADVKDADQEVPPQHPQMAELRKCHVLVFCPSEKAYLAQILPHLQKEGMLLVGDTPGFLEAGGTINLVLEDAKVRFEVNRAAAKRARLQIRSSLLRLAIRTLERDSLGGQDHEK
jgi:hypothetical protein